MRALFGNSLDFLIVESAIKAYDYDYRAVTLRDCKRKTLSNHCFLCMSMPILLTIGPSKSRCYCVDHVSLWFGNDTIVLNSMTRALGCQCLSCADKINYWYLGETMDFASFCAELDSDEDEVSFYDTIKLSYF